MQDVREIEERLKSLEAKLLGIQKELQATEKIAKQLQGLVTQNKFPQVTGIEFLSRYIPGEQSRAEGFDVFVNSQKNSMWFFYFSLKSYGLSSALFQTYLLLQSRSFFEQADARPQEAVDILLKDFPLDQDPEARVYVAHLHLSSLKWTECSIGNDVLILERKQQAAHWSAASEIPVESREAGHQIAPGTRLFFANRANLAAQKEYESSQSFAELKDDFNSMLFSFENRERKSKTPNDICFWALNISPKKIHLA